MYLITTNAASPTTRFRMPELCLGSASGARFEDRVNAQVVAVRITGDVTVSFKDAELGDPAWNPPA